MEDRQRMIDRKRERHTHTQTQIERDRQTETERQRQRRREREREREREIQAISHRKRCTEMRSDSWIKSILKYVYEVMVNYSPTTIS